MIRAERDGFYKRFYPVGIDIKKETYELSQIQKEIYNEIKNSPGIHQKYILKILKISQQKLNYHIQLMVNSHIVKLERTGNKTKCYVNKEISD